MLAFAARPSGAALNGMVLAILCHGCAAPSARLTFPSHPSKITSTLTWYDVGNTGRPNFAMSTDASGRVDTLYYDDTGSGLPDREYHLADYANADVPHVVILLDSIPYQSMVDAYAAGRFRWFSPPTKVIAPFPSLTEICYSDVLHAPPLPGVIDQSFDPRLGHTRDEFWARVYGHFQPWDRLLDYHATFTEDGLSFLHPKPWYAAELERMRAAVDASPYQTTVVYAGSAASMVCKYGRDGAREVLDGGEKLCLQLLYERHGAVKLSLMADHGHNFMLSKNVPIAAYLSHAGFHLSQTDMHGDNVVVEINGLVTYAGVQTDQPERVADALLPHAEIQQVMYQINNRVYVRDAHGMASIDCRANRLRYTPLTADVFGYAKILKTIPADKDGFVTDADWLAATADSQYPDAPRRVWDAFHRQVMFPPRVMVTLNDGWCAGLASYQKFITMQSTHGALNQVNTSSFVMTMTTPKLPGVLRSRDVMAAIEPGFTPRVHDR